MYRHVAGVDMLTDASQPRARSAIHFVCINERVRPVYAEPVPASRLSEHTKEFFSLPSRISFT